MRDCAYKTSVTSQPAVEPVTIADLTANDYLIDVDFTVAAETQLVTGLILQARKRAESWLNRKLITQTVLLTINGTPSAIQVPFGRLQSVASINVVDGDGDDVLQSSDTYATSTGDDGLIWLKSSNSWTSTTWAYYPMKISFVCGYGDAASDVPQPIKTAIMDAVAYNYENRESEMPKEIFNKAALYRILTI